MTTKALDQIEASRQKFIDEITRLTGLPADDISVDVSFHGQTNESELAIEARGLGWSPERYKESAWFALQDHPDPGGMSVFVE